MSPPLSQRTATLVTGVTVFARANCTSYSLGLVPLTLLSDLLSRLTRPLALNATGELLNQSGTVKLFSSDVPSACSIVHRMVTLPVAAALRNEKAEYADGRKLRGRRFALGLFESTIAALFVWKLPASL